MRRNSQRQMKENDQVWITVSPPCAMITPTHRAASGSVSPPPCGITCAANAALIGPQPAADRPEMIIYRAGTGHRCDNRHERLPICLRVHGPTLHTQMLSQTRVRNSQPPPPLRSPAHAESSMRRRFSIVNAYRGMVLRAYQAVRAHDNMLFPTLDAPARPTSSRSVTRSRSYSRSANLGERMVRHWKCRWPYLLLLRAQSTCRAAAQEADQAALL